MYKIILKFKLWSLKREKENTCAYLYCDGWDGEMCKSYDDYLENEINIIKNKIKKLTK
mgnify:CR=1 FL=1|tara:strand:+ start:307 stop:480 length:174 start_codon:yes stop_codon:yes gene_type:complete